MEDYLAFVERLLRLGRREEALRYAEEAVAWFGRDPRLLPLLDLLVAHRGGVGDHRARFRLRPNLEDYLALKAKLGRGFAEERPRLLRQVQDPALLARIHLLEEDWKALDRLLKRASPEAYPALAAVLEERLPQEAARLYLEAAKARVEAGGRAAYREAAGLLGRLARLDPKRAREAAWGLVRAYPRRRALREELAPSWGVLMNLTHNEPVERLPWVEVFRGLAILEVVLYHVTGRFLRELPQGSPEWLLLAGVNRTLHFAVPAFLFMTTLVLGASFYRSFACFLGRYSLQIYLVHPMVICLLERFPGFPEPLGAKPAFLIYGLLALGVPLLLAWFVVRVRISVALFGGSLDTAPPFPA